MRNIIRNVTAYSTLGGNQKTFSTSARVLRELWDDLAENHIAYAGMKLVVGESQVTLESPEAELPEGEFTLFLTAQKVKSGSIYDTDAAAGLVGFDGITWDEVDWEEPTTSIEEFTFVSEKDLNIARAKKISAYLVRIVDYMQGQSKQTSKPKNAEEDKLAKLAKEIEENINAGLFS